MIDFGENEMQKNTKHVALDGMANFHWNSKILGLVVEVDLSRPKSTDQGTFGRVESCPKSRPKSTRPKVDQQSTSVTNNIHIISSTPTETD